MTLLLYFNPGWSEADGGALRLHRGGAAGAGPPYEDVLPVAGRLVAFFSRTVWHEVLEARARARFAWTLWLERASDSERSREAFRRAESAGREHKDHAFESVPPVSEE